MNRRIKNGFGLIETMTAVAVSGVVLLAASQVANYVNQQVQKTVAVNDELQLDNIVQEKVSFADLCNAAMAAGAYPGTATTNPNPISLTGNNWKTTTGQPVKLYIPGIGSGVSGTGNTISSSAGDNVLPVMGLKIYSLDVQEGYLVQSNIQPGIDEYIAKLVMQTGPITSAGTQNISPPFVVGTLTLDLNNSSGAIVDCRGGVTQSASAVCQDMGCTYNSANNPACTCPTYSVGCSNPNQIPIGVDQSGMIICADPGGLNSACGPGTYLAGIVGQYNVCANYAQNTGTGSTTTLCPQYSNWSWHVGSNTCSSSTLQPGTATAPGTSVVINNTASNLTGSATFTCGSTGQWQVATTPAPTCSSATSSGCAGGTMISSGVGLAGGNLYLCNATNSNVGAYGCPWLGSSSGLGTNLTCTGSATVTPPVPFGCSIPVGACPTSGTPSLTAGQYCLTYINNGFTGDAGCGGVVYENGDTIGYVYQCCQPSTTSDLRLKTDVVLIGQEHGFNIYRFKYKKKARRLAGNDWVDPNKYYIGVIAQEVLKKDPYAVTIKDGYLAVRYGMIGIHFHGANPTTDSQCFER